MSHCPTCGTPYGKRKRCYTCQPGRPRTGKWFRCEECNERFYRQKNQIERGENRFCSRECLYKNQPGRPRKPNSKWRHPRGYLWVFVGMDYPSADEKGRMLEHRYVMEQHLGRSLEPEEVVHHINGEPDDNRIENLELMTHSEHARMHMSGRPDTRVKMTCRECGKEFKVKPSRVDVRKNCSRECQEKGHSKFMKEWWAERKE